MNTSRTAALRSKLIGGAIAAGIAASLAVVTAASGAAHAAPPPDPPPSGFIAGTVHLPGCNVSPTSVVIRVRETSFHFDNRISPLANGTFTVEVPRGEYTITPLSDPCPLAGWSPPTTTVHVLPGRTASASFVYRMPARTATFTPAELAGAVQSQLAGASLRVNGFDAGGSSSHFKPSDSTLDIGGLATFRFTAPAHHVAIKTCHLLVCVGIGDANWYVNDMRLDHTTTTFDHGWTVNGFLESGDRELKGFFKAPFTLNREVDDLMPDINVDNGVATVRLVPIVANGALTYGLESSSFDAQVQATGPCGLSFADVCDDIASYKQSVKTELAGHVTGALISDTARLAINLTIAQHVSDHGLSRVDTLDFDAAGNLILGEF